VMKINGAWEETQDDKFICRWCVAWDAVGPDKIAGAVAGYAGGGGFVVERFFATLKKDAVVSLWIDYTDRITGKEIDFDRCGKKALEVCESGLDEIWNWNDNDIWSDTDEVVLQEVKVPELSKKKEMRHLARDSASFVRTVCEKAGLTAAPKD